MNPLQQAIRRLADGESLSSAEAADAFDIVMAGDATAVQVAALLTALRVKGETAHEIAGAARALRRAMRVVTLETVEQVVDTCGTGGGAVGTLNVSTGAAFIVAGAGVPVAKHGNRSFTSRSGSADVLEALGVRIELEPREVPRVLEEAGLAFLFAPGFHPAMRHAAPGHCIFSGGQPCTHLPLGSWRPSLARSRSCGRSRREEKANPVPGGLTGLAGFVRKGLQSPRGTARGGHPCDARCQARRPQRGQGVGE